MGAPEAQVMVRSVFVRAIVTAIVLTLLPLAVHAQEVTLSGSIADSTDAVLPGATVTALHVASGNASSSRSLAATSTHGSSQSSPSTGATGWI